MMIKKRGAFRMSKFTRVLVLVVGLLLLAGCSIGFDAFKVLGAVKKDVPQYEVNSEILDKNPPIQIWSTINTKDIDENQAKQIQADYINKKLKENGQTLKGIMIIVNVKKDQYTAQYVKDEETLKAIAPEAEIPQKFPAIIYSKTS